MLPKSNFRRTIGLLLLFAIAVSCNNSFKQNKSSTNMAHTDYSALWRQVDSLDAQQLPQSALELVQTIEAKARKENNAEQLVRTTIYRGKYATLLEEDGLPKSIQIFENEIKTANQPQKAILQSMLGELYATYLLNSRWQLRDRTPVPDGEGGDILTWSSAQIEQKSLQLYLASLEQPELLQNILIGQIQGLLLPGSEDTINGIPLRPTLFDLLSQRAVLKFKNDQSFLNEPAYKFVITQPEAYAAPLDFVRAKFETKDLTSNKWLALQTFQRLTTYHLTSRSGGPNIENLLDVTLGRLEFVHTNNSMADKNTLYEQALQQLHIQYNSNPMDADILYALARNARNQAEIGSYRPEKKDVGPLNQKAVRLCEEAIKDHPGTVGAGYCAELLLEIQRKEITHTTEETLIPGKPVLMSINFRNVTTLWAKVVEDNQGSNRENGLSQDEMLDRIKSKKVIKEYEFKLPVQSDYLNHRTEVMLDPLPIGTYIVLLSTDKDFDLEKGLVNSARFNCSQLTAVKLQTNEGSTYSIVDRATGAPIPNVTAQAFRHSWENIGRPELLATTKSNQEGMVQFPLQNEVWADVLFTNGKDTLHYQEYNYRPGPEPEQQNEVVFFTDRGIYRPGQQIFFKGILLKRDDQKMPAIVANRAVSVSFYDVNNQVQSTLQVRSNEFGTFNGTFTAPIGGLTGSMYIRADSDINGSAVVQVEEYKRPKFEVKFDSLTGAYRLNETVKATAKALYYSGSGVNGAAVNWRVVRNAIFPEWGWRKYIPEFYSGSQEIADGTTVTDAQGQFEVQFTALPDADNQTDIEPIYQYSITADITDSNGETRSAAYELSVSKYGATLQLNLRDEMSVNDLEKIKIQGFNLAGQEVPLEGVLSIQAITQPAVAYLIRRWEKPDVYALGEREFKANFSNFAYKNEDDPEKWERSDYVVPFEFKTKNKATLDLRKTMPAGYYFIKALSKDAFGQDIKVEKIVHVWDANKRFELPDIATDKLKYEPGEQVQLSFGSQSGPLNVWVAEVHGEQTTVQKWHVANPSSSLSVPVTEADRGGLSMNWFCVRDNRFYGSTIGIEVPFSNKDLKITFETFRDQLEPGTGEEWRLRVSGPKKEKVAAEMVASMYDASLDQFMPFQWYVNLFIDRYPQYSPNGLGFGLSDLSDYNWRAYSEVSRKTRTFKTLNWFDFPFYQGFEFARVRTMSAAPAMSMDGAFGGGPGGGPGGGMGSQRNRKAEDLDSVVVYDPSFGDEMPPPPVGDNTASPYPAPLRRNLNETVFFYPELRTDANGDVLIKFKMNEALTRWKFQAMAHTKDLQYALVEKEVVTKKDLMITVNAPRFFRAGDEIEFSAKIINTSDVVQNGKASLSLLNAETLQVIEKEFQLEQQVQEFSVEPGLSKPMFWKIKIPSDYTGAVTWQVFADGKKQRDGEENTVPVVTNRILLTETLPMTVRGGQTKEFNFDLSTKKAPASTQRYTLEFTSNPVWYAVQALPYLMEYPHECSEQVFSRFYANTLAASVVAKTPAIKRVFDRWQAEGKDPNSALKSNLSKNQELKYALLEETPWVLAAQSEAQQKQNIALLFDLNKMANEQAKAIQTLAERQSAQGGWSWFPGGKDSWYITQHIACGMAHLDRLGAYDSKGDATTYMLDRALQFCQKEADAQYNQIRKDIEAGKTKLESDHLDGLAIQFLYTRSFYPLDRIDATSAFYFDQARKHWTSKSLQEQGMIALAAHRQGIKDLSESIVRSLRERAMVKDELGMYWPNQWGMYWYQLPVETQALMVEVFDEVAQDKAAVENLRIWLLKNKQTNRWESTKATSEAVYALLLHGDNWLDNTQPVQVQIAGKSITSQEYEAGTGYFKESWSGAEVKPSWSSVKITNPNSNIVWGSAYWQFFAELDEVGSFKGTGLTLVKQLFTVTNSPTGPVLQAVKDGQVLKVGDKLKVRVEIRADRAMEFVHLKDMRAAGTEPVNVLSGYRWKSGLGYYESTKDLATNFFFDYIPRGTHVLEYELTVSHRGKMSAGIATLQCMYAPEFTSHSQGFRVEVK